jgi:Fe2+ or Zn2+ uptake regulation protein
MTNHLLASNRGFFLKFESKSSQTYYKQGQKQKAEICLGQHCGNFIQKHHLGGPSTVKKTLNSLLEKELVYSSYSEEGKSYYAVYNVFLSRWLEYKAP